MSDKKKAPIQGSRYVQVDMTHLWIVFYNIIFLSLLKTEDVLKKYSNRTPILYN